MRILLATPTRGRAASFKEMVRSARRTANHPEQLHVVARIDKDDPVRGGYMTERGFTVMQGERVLLSQAWNEIADYYTYDILMMCADDIRFRTTGWDDDVVRGFEHWPDRIGLMYADDGIHGQKGATHSFVSRQWIDAVGYYLPPTLLGDYVDNWLMSLAASIGRAGYLPRCYIEHRHPLVGKASMDDTYAYRLSDDGRQQATAAWQQVLDSKEIGRAVEKLRGALSES
jgi:hypothetical protein